MDLTGLRIRNIEVLSLIGRGGMGEVYLGFDKVLERKVALKVLRSSLMDDISRVRFLREARVLSQLDHSGICRIYDVIEREGQQILVLEHVEGQTLDRAMSEGLSERHKLVVARQLTEVLEAAHGLGIIHRDLKPENVMWTPANTIKVLDFGLARHQGQEALVMSQLPVDKDAPPGATAPLMASTTDSDAVTRFGSIMGTVDYMSPEQARGDELTTESDLYSLGIILQELFTGKGAYPENLPKMHKIQLAATAETQPASGVDSQLADLIERLKTATPGARPRAADVRERLIEFEDRPRLRRRRLVVAGLVLLSIVAAWKYTLDLKQERDRTVVALAEAETQRAAAEKVTEFLVDVFKVSDPGRASGNEITAREVLDRGAERINQELAYQPALRARLAGTMGRVYHHLGLHTEAAKLLEQTVKQQRELYPSGHAQLADSLYALAGVHYMQDRYDEAIALFEESLAMQRALPSPSDVAIAATLEELGQISFEQGRQVEARRLLEKSLQLRAEALPEDHPNLATGLWTLGLILHEIGDLTASEDHFRRALTILEKNNSTEHLNYARVLEAFAALYLDQARWSEAEPLFRQSLAIRQRILPAGHQNLAISASYLALVVSVDGSYAEAERLMRQALSIFEANLGPDHYNVAANLIMLGGLLRETGRLDEAEQVYLRSLAIWRAAGLNENYNALVVIHSLGVVAALKGDLAVAEEYLQEALSGTGRTLGLDSSDGAEILADLAVVMEQTGQVEAAAGRWQQALESANKAVLKNPENLEAKVMLSQIELRRGASLNRAGQQANAKALWSNAVERLQAMDGADHQVDLMALRAEAYLYLDRRPEAESLLARLDDMGYSDPVLEAAR